jgi:DHA2 family multidrug resistance protein-like MFS transporter
VTKATFESQAEDAAEAVSGAAPVTHMADDAGHPKGLAPPRLYWSVLAIWLAMGMSVIDQSIANIALPTIAREVGASPAGSIWVLNANQIAVAMTLLPVAALGDIFGCRRIYLIGLCIFIAASIGCTFATSLTTLTIWRFVAGFGGGSIMAINAALVRYTYPPDRLGRGLGYNTLVIALTSASGPTIASAILSVAPWPALFAVNIPFGIAALVIGSRALPLTQRSHRRFDYLAALLNAIMFAMIFLAASDVAHGTMRPRTAIEAAIGAIAVALLLRRTRTDPTPLVPLDLLRIRILRLSYFASGSCFAAQTSSAVALPFFLHALGYQQVTIGLLITPLPVTIALTAPLAGRLVERVPAGLLGGVGLALYAAAMILIAQLGPGAHEIDIMWRIGLSGIGFALFQTPNNRMMIGLSPPKRSGAAAGMAATSRLIGQIFGAVLVALLFRLAGPASVAPFFTAAGIAGLAAVVSLRRMAAAD